jgi:eukaryotic-like serine/threonine-protein kinase
MKRFAFFIGLVVLLLLIPAGVSAATYLFVYSTPPGAAIYLNGTYLGGVTPRVQNAMPGVYTLLLQKSGYPDYVTTLTIAEGSTVTVDYDFENAAPGKSSITPTLSGITPSSGATDTVVSIRSLAGTNFASNAFIILKRPGSSPISGSITSVNAAGTQITGSFDLSDQDPGNYEVCVYNTAFIYACGLTFTITGPVTGSAIAGTDSSVYFETEPSGATVYLDNIEIGTSGFTYHDAVPGIHRVLIRKTGYKDYSGSVTVLDGKRVTFSAPLALLDEETTVATTAATAVPVRTATMIRKSTLKVPTTWPGDTPAEASPVDPVIVIGAAGISLLGLVVSGRR